MPQAKHLKSWIDDVKAWPTLTAKHITDYLILKKACDEKEAQNWKSLESYQYYSAGFVGAVWTCKFMQSTEFIFLKSKVRAGQTSAVFHSAWVCIEKTKCLNGLISTDNFEIIVGECTCKAGLGRTCSHIGAICFAIYFANELGYISQTCTDMPCTWNKGTRNVEPALIKAIDFKTETYQNILNKSSDKLIKKARLEVPKPIAYNSYNELAEGWKNAIFADVLKIEGTMASEILQEPLSTTKCSNQIDYHSHDSDTLFASCYVCESFYNKYVNIGEDKIAKIFTMTKTQSQSELWRSSRLVRITASGASSVPKKVSPENYFRNHLTKPFKGNLATEHGTIHEPIAIRQLENTYDIKVEECGTQICSKLPWLSGSPDGKIFGDTILEVKCPLEPDISLKSLSIKKTNCEEGHILTQGGRGYYLQVQLNMLCSNLKKALLYVWTSKEQLPVSVPYDETYVNEEIKRLQKFYFSFYLPRCADMYQMDLLKLSDEYVQFCKTNMCS